MSKTTKTFKGKTYKPRKSENKSKSKGDKKFFGWTNGTHSRKKDGAAIPGEDYVKYGYPYDPRNKKQKLNLQKEKEIKKQIKNLGDE